MNAEPARAGAQVAGAGLTLGTYMVEFDKLGLVWCYRRDVCRK